MKIVSYNINGIRAAMKKGLVEWLKECNPDVVCFQEIKANADQFEVELFEDLGYHCFWNSAEKKGYSGVALLSKQKPSKVQIGFGNELYDKEGRVIIADIGDISQVSVYIPSGSSGDIRQDFKMEFLDFFYDFIDSLKKEKRNLIISGDYNICHQAIDIHDPIRNTKNSGFLPEEREWFSDFLNNDMVDSFRYLNENIVKYSWWTYRARARENNKGWRIDYNIVTKSLEDRIKKAEIWNDVVHSDHCPVFLDLQ